MKIKVIFVLADCESFLKLICHRADPVARLLLQKCFTAKTDFEFIWMSSSSSFEIVWKENLSGEESKNNPEKFFN